MCYFILLHITSPVAVDANMSPPSNTASSSDVNTTGRPVQKRSQPKMGGNFLPFYSTKWKKIIKCHSFIQHLHLCISLEVMSEHWPLYHHTEH